MDQVVVDSSVAIKWFVSEPHAADAYLLLEEFQREDLELIAPDLLVPELANIVWKKQRQQGLSAVDGVLIIDAFAALPILLTPEVDPNRWTAERVD